MEYRVKFGPIGWLLGQTAMKMMMGKILDGNLKGLAGKVESQQALHHRIGVLPGLAQEEPSFFELRRRQGRGPREAPDEPACSVRARVAPPPPRRRRRHRPEPPTGVEHRASAPSR